MIVTLRIFFLIVLVVAWLLRPHMTASKTFMLASSIFFSGWWRHTTDEWPLFGLSWLPRYAIYLLVFAAVNHGLAFALALVLTGMLKAASGRLTGLVCTIALAAAGTALAADPVPMQPDGADRNGP